MSLTATSKKRQHGDPVRFTARSLNVVRDGVDVVLQAALDAGQSVEIVAPAGLGLMIHELPKPRTAKKGGAQ